METFANRIDNGVFP